MFVHDWQALIEAQLRGFRSVITGGTDRQELCAAVFLEQNNPDPGAFSRGFPLTGAVNRASSAGNGERDVSLLLLKTDTGIWCAEFMQRSHWKLWLFYRILVLISRPTTNLSTSWLHLVHLFAILSTARMKLWCRDALLPKTETQRDTTMTNKRPKSNTKRHHITTKLHKSTRNRAKPPQTKINKTKRPKQLQRDSKSQGKWGKIEMQK